MRLLLVRTSALGDIVHCLPALRALRRELPRATVGWVVEEAFAPLLERDPDIDELLVVRTRPWRGRLHRAATWSEIRATIARLRAFRADAVLDLMGNHKAGLLAALSSCRRRIGLERHIRRESSSALWLNEFVTTSKPHTVDRALAVAMAVAPGCRFDGFGADRIRQAAAGEATPSDEPYLVIHPGAAWANKCYPPDRWGTVASTLAERTGWRVLLSLGPGEAALGDEVAEASGGVAAPAPGRGLPALVALLAGARLVLGGDTGPSHLAHALGVPTLFVHGPTDPARHGPYGHPERAVFHRLPCSFCHRRYSAPQRCLLDLPPRVVAAAAIEMLEAVHAGI